MRTSAGESDRHGLQQRAIGWLRTAAVLLLFAGCDGSLGCLSCGGGYDYPDPAPPGGTVLEETLVGHLQESGVRFLAEHVSEILRARFPTRVDGNGVERVSIYLPEPATPIGSTVQLDIRDGCEGNDDPASCTTFETYPSRIELNLDTLDDAVDVRFRVGGGSVPDSVELTFYDVDIYVDAAVTLLVAGTDATCLFYDVDESTPSVHLQQLQFAVSLDVDVQDNFYAEVIDVSVDLGAFGSGVLGNLSVDPCTDSINSPVAHLCADPTCTDGFLWPDFECQVYCGAADITLLAADFVGDFVLPLLEWAVPPVVESAMSNVLDEVNGQPLRLAARYRMDEIFGPDGLLPPLLDDPTSLSFGAFPNADAFVVSGPSTGRGMSAHFDAGTFAPQSPCVPTVSVPSFAGQITQLPFFDGRLEFPDASIESYDVAVAFSDAFADQTAFAMYQIGAECLILGSDTLSELAGGGISAGALALLVPSVLEIADPTAPLMFQLHPTSPPRVSFGSGEVIGFDPDNNPIVDSLLQVDFGEMGLSIYALVDGAYLRVSTVAFDVHLGVPLVRTPRNTLELGLDRIEVGNVVQVYNEILEPSDFAGLVEVLVNVALGAMLTTGGSFDLDLAPIVSRMLGGAPVYARINDVRGTDPDTEGFMVAYVTFCDDADLLDPSAGVCFSPAGGTAPPRPPRVVIDPAFPGLAGPDLPPGSRPGRVLLEVDAEREYQSRVDGSPWTSFRGAGGGRLVVRNTLLRLPGVHRIEIRGRDPGRYWTRQGAPDVLTVLVVD